jgi:hypothetical protein
MKYQPRHELIDPEFLSPGAASGNAGTGKPEAVDDAYVIGELGSSIREIQRKASRKAKRGPARWVKPAALGLLALSFAMTLWNLSHFLQAPPPAPKPTAFQVKQALYLGVMKIDAYRRVHGGITPDTLADVGLPAEGGYAYNRVSPTRYVVSFGAGGSKVEYDSNEPKERYFGSPRDMLTIGGSK